MFTHYYSERMIKMLNFVIALEEGSKAQSTVDDKLIEDIAEGNMDALRKLYETVHKTIYAFALSITKNTHDAEDVLQETFLKIYQKAKDYTSYDKPMAWIFTIARNFALMKFRDRKKEDSTEEVSDMPEAIFSFVEDVSERIVLETAVNKLDENERTILLLHAVSGLKNREIAELLDMPINTVLSKYNRTIKKMQKYLEEEGF